MKKRTEAWKSAAAYATYLLIWIVGVVTFVLVAPAVVLLWIKWVMMVTRFIDGL